MNPERMKTFFPWKALQDNLCINKAQKKENQSSFQTSSRVWIIYDEKS